MGKRRGRFYDNNSDRKDREVGYFTSSLTSLDWRVVAPVVGFAVVAVVVIFYIFKARNLGKQAQMNSGQSQNSGPFREADPRRLKMNQAIAEKQQEVVQNNDPNIIRGYNQNFINIAPLQAWFGQDKELAVTCEETLKFLKNTRSPAMAERAAKICSLRPMDQKIHKAALILAQRAVELGKGNAFQDYFQMALGMAEYRCGNYDKADAALLDASQLGKSNYAVTCTSAFYRAMSLFRQGKEAEAQKLAAEATAKMKPLPVDEQNPLAGGANIDDLIVWMAYKESKELLKQ